MPFAGKVCVLAVVMRVVAAVFQSEAAEAWQNGHENGCLYVHRQHKQ